MRPTGICGLTPFVSVSEVTTAIRLTYAYGILTAENTRRLSALAQNPADADTLFTTLPRPFLSVAVTDIVLILITELK